MTWKRETTRCKLIDIDLNIYVYEHICSRFKSVIISRMHEHVTVIPCRKNKHGVLSFWFILYLSFRISL